MLHWVATWHDSWEVVGAIATAVAVIIALRGQRIEARARVAAEKRATAAETARDAERARADAQRAADEAAQRDFERTRQAFAVIAWVEPVSRTVFQGGAGNAVTDFTNHLRVINASDAPVFDLQCHLHSQATGRDAHGSVSTVIPAGTDRDTTLLDEWAEDPQPFVTVTFRDLHGRWWRRYQTGDLEETDAQHRPLTPPMKPGAAEVPSPAA